MNERGWSLSEAAAALGVQPKTLQRWLIMAKVPVEPDPDDRRRQIVSMATLEALAHIHKRALRIPSSAPSFEQLADQVRALQEDVRMLWEMVQWRGQGSHPVEHTLSAMHPPERARHTELSPRSHIFDLEAIILVAIDLLKSAPSLLIPRADTITLVMQAETDPLDFVDEALRDAWRTALRDAVSRNWKIIHLIRRPSDFGRTMKLIEGLVYMPGVTDGGYSPCYFSSLDSGPDLLVPRSDLILVPGRGVLEMIRPTQSRHVDSAWIHPHGSKRFVQLSMSVGALLTQSRPVIKGFSPRFVDFDLEIARADAETGDRCLVMNGLSDLSVPNSMLADRARYLQGTGLAAPDPEKVRRALGIVEAHLTREHGFERVVQHDRIRDLCPEGAILDYVKSGGYSPHDAFRQMGCPALSRMQRRAHLQQLIKRLATHKNYELGLIGGTRGDIPPSIYRTFWMVKRGHVVLLECDRGENSQGASGWVDLKITEPDIVEEFYRYSEQLWAGLPSQQKNKQQVIQWLRARVEEIDQMED